MPPSTDWMQQAACRKVPTALFFPPLSDDDYDIGDEDVAKAVCRACPVEGDCREHQRHEIYGIRFNTNPKERGVRGKTAPARPGLQPAFYNLLMSNPTQEWTIPQIGHELRRWPETSIRAVVINASRKGLLNTRVQGSSGSHTNPRITYYSWKATS